MLRRQQREFSSPLPFIPDEEEFNFIWVQDCTEAKNDCKPLSPSEESPDEKETNSWLSSASRGFFQSDTIQTSLVPFHSLQTNSGIFLTEKYGLRYLGQHQNQCCDFTIISWWKNIFVAFKKSIFGWEIFVICRLIMIWYMWTINV